MIDYRVIEAIRFATKAHAGQIRRGSDEPYVVHPVEVMGLVATVTEDPDVLVAAVLHDVVEDTDYTIADIAQRFGEPVAALVELLTTPPLAMGQDKARVQLDHLRGSYEAAIIKVADQTSNLRDIKRYDPPGNWGHYAQKAERLVAGIQTAFPEVPKSLLDAFYSARNDLAG